MKFPVFSSHSFVVKISILFFVVCYSLQAYSQSELPPGFDPVEYADLMQVEFTKMSDSTPNVTYDLRKGAYHKIMRTPVVGLYNLAEMYVQGNTAFLVLRGTVGKAESWLENFYMAMVKANGSLVLNDSTTFNYKLAADPMATVHVGWLVGWASLAPYVDMQLQVLLQQGVRNFVVMGHSQGGALAFLATSYLYYKYHDQYADMRLKTYASAAPKPGNLNYAYDFDFIIGNQYGFRIVNTADWVPETPVTVQTNTDFAAVNPLIDAPKLFKKQKFFVKLLLNHVYNRLGKSNTKAMKRYRNYLGNKVYKRVKKALPQYVQPNLEYNISYMPAGTPVILYADSDYLEQFKFDGKDYFVHHQLKPYMYLLNKYYKVK